MDAPSMENLLSGPIADSRVQGLSSVFSPDDRFVLTAGVKGTWRLWDPGAGEKIRDFKGHQGDVQPAT